MAAQGTAVGVREAMVVNLLCHLIAGRGSCMRRPDFWSYSIREGVLDEINIYVSGLNKADCPP